MVVKFLGEVAVVVVIVGLDCIESLEQVSSDRTSISLEMRRRIRLKSARCLITLTNSCAIALFCKRVTRLVLVA